MSNPRLITRFDDQIHASERFDQTFPNDDVVVFPSIEAAMRELKTLTNHVVVSGGGEIYKSLIAHADTLHISTIDSEPEGNVFFPEIPKEFNVVFEQEFHSNINYRYQIWQRG